jgi:TP901 family phage tail tape measure protein
MAVKVGSLVAVLTAQTQQFDRKMTRAQRTMAVVRGAAMRLGATLGAGFAFVNLGKSVEQFNRGMATSLAIMKNITPQIRSEMEKTAKDVARVTIFSAEEVAKAYFFLASAGLNAQQSLAAIGTVAQFAQAGMFNLSDATSLLTDAQAAMGLKSKDAQKNLENMTMVGNALVTANTLADATVRQFAEALAVGGARAAQFGMDTAESVAVLAALAERGTKASEAGTALDIIVRELTNKGNKFADAWEDLGVKVFDADENFRGAVAVIADMGEKLGELSDRQKIVALETLGLTNKSNKFILKILEAGDEMKHWTQIIRENGTAMADVAARNMTPLQKATARLGVAWLELGQQFETGVIARLVTALAITLEWINKTAIFTKTIASWTVIFKCIATAAWGMATNVIQALSRMVTWAAEAAEVLPDWIGIAPSADTVAKLDAMARGMTAVHEAMKQDVEEGFGALADIGETKTVTSAMKIQIAVEEMMHSISEAGHAAEDAGEKAGQALAKLSTDVHNLEMDLQKQIDTFGMSADAIKLWELAQRGATDAMLEQVKALQEQLQKMKDEEEAKQEAIREAERMEEDMKRAAERVIEETRTPLEKFEKRIDHLRELFEKGLIDEETFRRATEMAEKALPGAEAAKAQEFRQVNLARVALQGTFGTAIEKQATESGQELMRQILEKIERNQHDPILLKAG